ncbi:hypothetical protein Lnau_3058 [Legionella nautarum]|uniref:Uncharacterized protein n=1 Tax=Legionella nautarum TaxID=45070 RepID=A0A0W0WIS8_9GAMM|nr:hypothetical protein Lnau_3058 [Legionella nautarum]
MIKGTNKLDTVKQAFRHWRTTRTRRGQIPDELWEQVKGLLGDYTLSKIGSHFAICCHFVFLSITNKNFRFFH